MSLFDEMPRTELKPREYAQPAFDYINQAAIPEAVQVRELTEAWFADLPPDGRDELRARFRSPEENQHLGAFFELYCHALLRNHGFTVETHQPADQSKRTLPDFLSYSQADPAFYLESTLATEDRGSQGAAQRLAKVQDALNRVDSPDFFLHVELHASPSSPPSGSRLRSFIRNKLEGLDPDEIKSILEQGDLDAVPHWTWKEKGLEMTVLPIPKSTEIRGKPGIRPIGTMSYGIGYVDCQASIRNSLRDKAKRYGVPDLPYVIAVDATDQCVDDTDVGDVLMGTQCWTPQGTGRSHDGLWFAPSGPVYQRVSAVLSVTRLNDWNVARRTPMLWHNPWADKPLDPEMWQIPQMVPNHATDTYERREGIEAWELFGLWPAWPEGDPAG